MLGSELFQIFLIGLVLRGLFVLGEPCIILLFSAIGLTLACFTFFRRQNLPSFTDDLSDFGERKVLAFEKLSDLYGSLAMISSRSRYPLRLEKMTYAEGGRSGAFSSGWWS